MSSITITWRMSQWKNRLEKQAEGFAICQSIVFLFLSVAIPSTMVLFTISSSTVTQKQENLHYITHDTHGKVMRKE